MFIYIWKAPDGTPFYVGLTNNSRRTNPRNNGGRNWLTRKKLDELGFDNITVELRHVESKEAGQQLERELILLYGRVDLGTGPLTNLRQGGDGVHSPTPEHRAKLRAAMLNPLHPSRSSAAREKQRSRMKDPDVIARFLGDNNPAKQSKVRAKLKEKWADPEYRERQRVARTGVTKTLSEATKAVLRENLTNNPAMTGWGARNGKDPEFDAKRIAGIRAAQDRRREKMADPEALAKRKAKLRETMATPEFKAKRAERNTPEYRAKLSAARREYWARKKAAG